MTENQSDIAIIILAAGASTRLGSPKQLVKIQDKYLLEKTVETALETSFRPIVVVLGAYVEKIKKSIAHLPVHMVINEKWENGMGSSIACGINYLNNHFPNIYGTLIILADQPFITASILQKLPAQAKACNTFIAAAEYEGTLGPPAFFNSELFSNLKELDGKGGAKKLFAKYKNEIACINFPAGIHDVDTPEDVSIIRSLTKFT